MRSPRRSRRLDGTEGLPAATGLRHTDAGVAEQALELVEALAERRGLLLQLREPVHSGLPAAGAAQVPGGACALAVPAELRWASIPEEGKCPGAGAQVCYSGKTREHFVKTDGTGGYEPDPRSPDCQRCHGTGRVTSTRETWVPDGRTIKRLLAAYFDIDLDRAAQERQAVYEAVASRVERTVEVPDEELAALPARQRHNRLEGHAVDAAFDGGMLRWGWREAE